MVPDRRIVSCAGSVSFPSSGTTTQWQDKADGDLTVIFAAFDHSVAICELHLHAMQAGADLLFMLPQNFTANPLRFWEVLSDQCITYTFAPNSFLAAATQAYRDSQQKNLGNLAYTFRHLRVLFCGGEANKTATLSAASELVQRHGAPENAITAVYGLSETCSALFYNRNGPAYDVMSNHNFASVGVPLPEHEVRIVDADLQSVKTGSIQLRGPMISTGYYNDAAATEACITRDGWFDTGDLGHFDGQGNLVIIGRSKEVLVLNGQNYSSGELEYSIESSGIVGIRPGFTASFSILSGDSDSEEVVILFCPTESRGDNETRIRQTLDYIRDAVIRFCGKRPLAVIPLPESKLPRSSIGKLSRAKLRSSFLRGDFDEYKREECQEHPILASHHFKIIAQVLKDSLGLSMTEISANIPLERLGIDSLGLLKLRSAIERVFSLKSPLSLPQIAACRSILDIEQLVIRSQEGQSTPYTSLKTLRPTGSKTPLILCHPGNGDILNYMGLWPLIQDRKILALYARGLESGQSYFTSLTEMLDTYLHAIKREQPKGPYALFGLCFGGILAFELSKRLEAQGDQVVFCGGLDTPVDVTIMRAANTDRDHFMSILRSTGIISSRDESLFPLGCELAPAKDLLRTITSLMSTSKLESAGLSEHKLDCWVKMSLKIQTMVDQYAASGTVGTFDVFYTADPPAGTDIPDSVRWRYVYMAEWKRHVSGASNEDICFDYSDMKQEVRGNRPLRLHLVPGTHENVTIAENLTSLARAVDNAILLREVEVFSKRPVAQRNERS